MESKSFSSILELKISVRHAGCVPTGKPSISLRPETLSDEPFLYALYASTREEEMALVGWDEAMRAGFLQMQFRAQRLGYQAMFPDAAFSIVLANGQPGGRLVVHRTPTEIRVVDLVLAPSMRGQGIGTLLLREILAESSAVALPVRLHVVHGNRAALFYRRLGFVQIGASESHAEMERPPNDGKICNRV